jgi:hypothetical protein
MPGSFILFGRELCANHEQRTVIFLTDQQNFGVLGPIPGISRAIFGKGAPIKAEFWSIYCTIR